MDPRTGLDDVERRKILPLPGLELQPLGRPARRLSLYRLRHPGSCNLIDVTNVVEETAASIIRVDRRNI
jgi:hypothetical protein